MSYRDDRDADRARIEALEAELAEAKRKVEELEGHDKALVLASRGSLVAGDRPSAATRWLGAPLQLRRSREFTGALPADRFEDLIEPIRAIVGEPGRTEILKQSLTWSSTTGPKAIGPFLVVTVSVRDGVTRLVVGDRLGQAAGAIFGGVGGGVGGGTIIVPIMAGITLGPILIPVFLAGWLGGAMLGCRAIYQRIARRRAEQLQRVFDAVSAEIERELGQSRDG